MIDLNKKWDKLLLQLQSDIAEDIDFKGVLFLIGVQELQIGIKDFTKEEQDEFINSFPADAFMTIQEYFEN